MTYPDFIYIARYCFPVTTAIFFLIKLIGGERKDKIHSLIICCVCGLYFLMPEIDIAQTDSAYKADYIESLFIVILISGAGMLVMFSMIIFDKKAFVHALILALIVGINFMLTWHYTVSPQIFFYNYFDELIITVSIIQILVSHDGIIDSISNIARFFRPVQGAFSRLFVPRLRCMGNVQTHKRRGDKRCT